MLLAKSEIRVNITGPYCRWYKLLKCSGTRSSSVTAMSNGGRQVTNSVEIRIPNLRSHHIIPDASMVVISTPFLRDTYEQYVCHRGRLCVSFHVTFWSYFDIVQVRSHFLATFGLFIYSHDRDTREYCMYVLN